MRSSTGPGGPRRHPDALTPAAVGSLVKPRKVATNPVSMPKMRAFDMHPTTSGEKTIALPASSQEVVAPSITGTSVQGNEVDLNDFKGDKNVLVVFYRMHT